MSEALRPVAAAERRRPAGGWIWFALMVGGWCALLALLLVAPAVVSDLWRELRDLPFVVEALVWLLVFPFALAAAVWESSWPEWVRVVLVCSFALVWSVLFFPRKRTA